MAAPVLWAASIVACAALRPGYSHVTQYISELGERGSPTELLMRYTGFVPTGLLHVAFAVALCATFRRSPPAVIAATLLAVNGLARAAAGFFPCEPGCAGTAATFAQRLHSISATIGFLALIGSVSLWSVLFRHHPAVRDLAVYSAASAAVGLVFLALMAWSAEPGTARGLYERFSSGALSLWVFVFAIRLWKSYTRLTSQQETP